MYLIDTTVWIDFFRFGDDRISSIVKNNSFYTNDIIITEYLQGVKNDKDYEKLKKWFIKTPNIALTQDIFLLSSDIFRNCRKQGITVRKTIDCIIAASAIKYDLILLGNDYDFELITKCTKLKYEKTNPQKEIKQ